MLAPGLSSGYVARALSALVAMNAPSSTASRLPKIQPQALAQALAQAQAQEKSGDLEGAVVCYQQLVAQYPDSAIAWLHLGRSLRKAKRLEVSLPAFRKAVEIAKKDPSAWSLLSNALRESNQLQEARRAASQALAIHPLHAQAHLNEGAALHQLGELEFAALSYFVASTFSSCARPARANLQTLLKQAPTPRDSEVLQKIVSLLKEPANSQGLTALGLWALKRSRFHTALVLLHRAAAVPNNRAGYLLLAQLSWQLGHEDAAESQVIQALEHAPQNPEAYQLFSEVQAKARVTRRLNPQSVALYRACPDDAQALTNLGIGALRRAWSGLANEVLRRALALFPDGYHNSAPALLSLGKAHCNVGEYQAAVACFRSVIQHDLNNWSAYSSLLFSLHFSPNQSPQDIFSEHVRFGVQAESSVPAHNHCEQRGKSPSDPLRIGYVSADFRQHPVAYFIEPILRHHATANFEVHCYSDVRNADDTTGRLASIVSRFSDISQMSDAELAQKIADDGIDILVDLAGHTGGNRLLTFACKPSPIQVSWIGYFSTTGLSRVDYRLVDTYSVDSSSQRLFTEELLLLPRSSNCFLPPLSPRIPELPALSEPGIRFGSFNNPAKITRRVVGVWARILHAVAGSKLLLVYGAFEEPAVREQLVRWFSDESVDSDRIQTMGHLPLSEFLNQVSQVDIALDPFPHSGETTALHCLWMGVPVIALQGNTLVQRLASRVLKVVGLTDWVATTEDEYVQIAQAATGDLPQLAQLREDLRSQMLKSPLLDHEGITRDLEVAYLQMWTRYSIEGCS